MGLFSMKTSTENIIPDAQKPTKRIMSQRWNVSSKNMIEVARISAVAIQIKNTVTSTGIIKSELRPKGVPRIIAKSKYMVRLKKNPINTLMVCDMNRSILSNWIFSMR